MKWGIISIIVFVLLANRLLVSLLPAMQLEEICDNGQDDDGDGLIDLNDPDCTCPSVEPVSLIPNPSFEDYICCPRSRGLLSCAETWIQASAATTDFLHTCNWMGWDSLPVPLPMPDGEGCIGYRNGRFNTDDFSDRKAPNYKEYVGACLPVPLQANTNYQFRFNVGFTHAENSPPTDVVFYGTTNCDNLPFGDDNREFGCPTNDPGWVVLGSVSTSGTYTWVKTEIDIQPQEDIFAIAIGPSCEEQDANADLYYFLDNLTLANQKAFEFEIRENGNPCSNSFSLRLPAYDTLQYQWYLDGVAIMGATGPSLEAVSSAGNYQVRLISPEGCKVTSEYYFERPAFFAEQEAVICQGETYRFHSQNLQSTGTYLETVKTAENCDSTIQLNLKVVDQLVDSVSVKIFPGESYAVGSQSFSEAGRHLATLSTALGCDSTLLVDLKFYQVFVPNVFSPNQDGVNDAFVVYGTEDLIMIQRLQVFNRWGQLVYEGKELLPNDTSRAWDGRIRGGQAPDGVYIYTASLLLADGVERTVTGTLSLLR